MPPTTAQERAAEAASRYLSNIVVIDDKMSMGDSGDTHGLNVDELSNAFAKVDFSCGIYKPRGLQDEAGIIAKLVRKSDAAVLDWNLTNGLQADALGAQQATGQGTALCTSVIRKVLEDDDSSGNPIRLLLIYTAEGINETLVQDLHAALGRDELEVLPTGEFGLASQNVKIVFKAKPSAGGAAIPFDRTTLSLLDLPGYIVEQYAELASGLMPPAILHGLAALREKTGALLGTFNKSLDPAMVMHAILMENKEDASNYLCTLLSEECASIIGDCSGIHNCLSTDAVEEWVRQKNNYTARHESGIVYTSDYIAKILKTDGHDKFIPGNDAIRMLSAIYDDDNWWCNAKNFCRLCTLKHDPHSSTRSLAMDFKPKLTLGTILKRKNDYFLCIVPPCDAARVTKGQQFPFIKLVLKNIDENFSFSVGDSSHDDRLLAKPKTVSWKTLSILRFCPTKPSTKALGQWDQRLDAFYFKEANGNPYEWLGELKRHVALKLAIDLAPGLSRVGVDEFDWLRRKAQSSANSDKGQSSGPSVAPNQSPDGKGEVSGPNEADREAGNMGERPVS